MRREVVILLVLAVSIALSYAAGAPRSFKKTTWQDLENGYSFEQWKEEFRKVYPAHEEQFRKELFETKLNDIIRHNRNPHATWKKGVNHLSAHTNEEFKKLLGYKKSITHARRAAEAQTFPEEQVKMGDWADWIDWRVKNIISDVKDQGGCGSCWTFATAESVESYWALSTGQLAVLSEQQILDCTPNPQHCCGTGGCAGGTTEIAFEQIIQMGGLSSEWTYPYLSYQGSNFNCSFNVNTTAPFATVSSYTLLPPNQYTPIMDAVQNGPLAISVDASAWGDYELGVFNGCNNTYPDIDHAVQLVGYGTDDTYGDYWLVRNSWSPNWGENGYIRIGRSSNITCGVDIHPFDGIACDGANSTAVVCGNCGILYDVTYPTI